MTYLSIEIRDDDTYETTRYQKCRDVKCHHVPIGIISNYDVLKMRVCHIHLSHQVMYISKKQQNEICFTFFVTQLFYLQNIVDELIWIFVFKNMYTHALLLA